MLFNQKIRKVSLTAVRGTFRITLVTKPEIILNTFNIVFERIYPLFLLNPEYF
jgi:hypothetical protein